MARLLLCCLGLPRTEQLINVSTSIIPSPFGVHAVATYHHLLPLSVFHARQIRHCKFSSDSSSRSSRSSGSSRSVRSRAKGFGGNTDSAAASFTGEVGVVSIEWASSKVGHPVQGAMLRKAMPYTTLGGHIRSVNALRWESIGQNSYARNLRDCTVNGVGILHHVTVTCAQHILYIYT